jgi:tRNA-dihydrouridine synthase
MLALSGADGVMVGRGAYGRPWMPGHLALYAATGTMPAAPSGDALLALVLRHYDAILDHYGAWVGVKAARKHIGWYMGNLGAPPAARAALMTGTDAADVARLLAVAFREDERVAA